jgi:DNA mismatch repair protein MutS
MAKNVIDNLPNMTQIINLLDNALNDEVPARISDGNVIKQGYSEELDELRRISKDSKEQKMKWSTFKKQLSIIRSK